MCCPVDMMSVGNSADYQFQLLVFAVSDQVLHYVGNNEAESEVTSVWMSASIALLGLLLLKKEEKFSLIKCVNQ